MIDISKDLSNILEDFSENVVEKTNEVIAKVAKDSVQKLKTAGNFNNRTGKYRKGWKSTPVNGKFGVISQVIHNPKEYRLTHLLEYGHINRDGSRTKAYPHIKAIEDEAEKNILSEIEKKL